MILDATDVELPVIYSRFVEDQSAKRSGDSIPKDMRHIGKQNANFFFGTRQVNGNLFYIGKPQDKDGHVLVIGGAGTGKSSCIAIPTLGTWGGTFFAIDIKGELSKNWTSVKKTDYPVKFFDFSREKEGGTFRYDPFYLLREGDPDDLVQNAREIAQAIIPIPPDVKEPFWRQSAQNILTAVILYVCGMKERDPDTGELLQGTFNQAMAKIQSEPIWELIKEIEDSGNKVAIAHINQFRKIENPEDNEMLTGIGAELSTRVMLFATDNRVRAAFTKDDDMMKWEDLEDHNIFMRIPEDKLGQWDGAITMMLTQLIRTLERRPDKYSGERKLPPVLVLLDEFPRLGKIDVIQNAVSTLRSKGVTICLIVQSFAQLDKFYGNESRRIIVDNCQYKAIFSVTDPENQKLISDMIGTINVRHNSISDIGSIDMEKTRYPLGGIVISDGQSADGQSADGQSDGKSRRVSISMSVVREPIIFPDELATLKDILLLTPEGFCRVNKLPYYCSPVPCPQR